MATKTTIQKMTIQLNSLKSLLALPRSTVKFVVPTKISIAATMLLASSNLAALGLGALEVNSNLDQPLDSTIELRVAPGDDVGTVAAAIASRDDFERLGIDYPSYLENMSLSVENMGGGNYVLRVVSNDVIIKEPFIHFLVRVDWSGGSFLREYTALIDPPVYAAEAPQSIAEPRVVGTDEAFEAEPEPSIAAEDISTTESAEVIFNETTTETVSEEPVYEEPVYEEPLAEQSTTVDEYSLPTDAQYGPVARGESLSVIAAELQRQFPDLSIYQIMQVLFEENRGAFINENINGLMEGEVLNIGDLNAIRQVDVAQAKNFFYEQINEWDPSVLTGGRGFDEDGLRVGQDEYSFDDPIAADETSSLDSTDFGTTEAFQVGASNETAAVVSSGDVAAREAEVLALQQQVSQLETSLASSSLENQELTERISLLEGQLADMNRLLSLDVEDAEMAAVEATLAEQNNAQQALADSSDAGLESTVSDTDSEIADTAIDDTVVADESAGTDDGGFIDPLAGLDEFSLQDEAVGEEGAAVDATDTALAEPDSATAETASESTPVAATKPVKSSSFFSNLQKSVVDSGLWKILAGAGALVVAGMGLWFVRRRRADEEFEISMMSIESQSQSASDEREVSVPEEADKSKTADRETSFLTVYSDSDAVVQADEVDPVAEADVYIAYGRDEQAEEVLLDGIASKPARVDIKQKLLTLYHKNNNVGGFERIAEELYSQKNFLTKNVWQEVSLMGKDLAPENPLFDVSASDLLSEEGESDKMVTSGDQLDDESTVEESSETVEETQAAAETSAASADDVTAIEFAEEDPSINLINFDDGQSEISELDEVALDDLVHDDDTDQDEAADSDDSSSADKVAGADEATDLQESEDQKSGGKGEDSVFEIDFSDEDDLADADTSLAADEEHSEVSIQSEAEVSDLEIADDYDEARTQYELAKVFVDLGDEDGARKILDDIVSNDRNSQEVLEDASKLLESINT